MAQKMRLNEFYRLMVKKGSYSTDNGSKKGEKKLTTVGLEPTRFPSSALSYRLRPTRPYRLDLCECTPQFGLINSRRLNVTITPTTFFFAITSPLHRPLLSDNGPQLQKAFKAVMAKKKQQQKEKKVQDAATLSRINFLQQAARIVPLPLQRHYLTTSRVAMKKTMLKLYP